MKTKQVVNCKACQITTHVKDTEIQQLLERLINANKIQFVDESLYLKRIAICQTCEYLEQQATCRQCGCLIHIRAAGKKSRCPYPKHSKW